MRRLLAHLTYANVMSSIAVFLVLTGGTAVALTGKNTVFSDDITNNEVRTDDVRNDNLSGGGLASADIRPNALTSADVSALTGADVNDNSLTGADVNESTFGQVPSAANAGNAGTLDGKDSTGFLGATAKATDSDKLDGLDSSAFLSSGGVRKLIYEETTSTGTNPTNIATVGPYTIKARCFMDNFGTDTATLEVFAAGPAGVKIWADHRGINNSSSPTHGSGAQDFSANTDPGTLLLRSAAPSGGNREVGYGTIMLKTGSDLIQLYFHSSASSLFDDCALYGTATKGT